MASFAFGPPPPGAQQASPEQIQAIQQQIAAEAAKQGISVQEYIEKMRAHAMAQRQAAGQPKGQAQGQAGPGDQHQHQQQPQQQTVQRHVNPQQPGPPNPAAIALAKFLKGQELKHRTCLYQEKRKDMFRGESHSLSQAMMQSC